MPDQRWTEKQKRRARLVGGMLPVVGVVLALVLGVLWGQEFAAFGTRLGPPRTIVRLGVIALVLVTALGITVAVLVDRIRRRRD